MPLEVAPQFSVGAPSLGYVDIRSSNALYLIIVSTSSRTVHVHCLSGLDPATGGRCW